ncbi:MFS general substrate transporter [Yamadazyma tenuis ATCC 10573]|nr:MFS general substrate transporter [Yamadazyma tenuis ATCC 10573]EGV64788.1 MFS general substrate transporter [Yamadazyma tenuis ATCC 10573]
MATAGATTVHQVYCFRFFVGLFESTAYVGIMTLLSNFYLPSEMGKRTCIFQTSSSAAQMFSGYLQSALYSGMNGRGGLAAWRWLFIFDGVITFPVAFVGYFAIPDEPFSSKAKWFNEKDRRIGTERMRKGKINTKPKIKVSDLVALISDWPFWIFSLAFTGHVLGIKLYSYMNLWLKSTGDYSVQQLNNLPTAGYGAQIFFTLCWAWLSDGIGKRWPVVTLATVPAIIGTIILWVWPEHNRAALFAGWYLLFIETGAGALFISWIAETMSTNVEQRYLLIGLVETVSFTFSAWVPLYLYPADEAPRYKYAYPLTFMFFLIEALCALSIALIQHLEKKGVLKNKHEYEVYVEDDEQESHQITAEKESV